MNTQGFSSILNLGNFLVATSITYLLSLLLKIDNNGSNITVNLNYQHFTLVLFFLIILALLTTWIFYEIKFKKLDPDGQIGFLELNSLLLFLFSIILLTIGAVLLVEQKIYYNINFGIGLIGLGFVLQSISDSLTLVNAAEDNKQILADEKNMMGSFKKITVRLSASIAFLVLGANYTTFINDDDVIFNNWSNQEFLEYFLCILVILIIMVNILILHKIISLNIPANFKTRNVK